MGSSSEDDGSLVVKEEHMGEDGMDEDMDPWDDHPRRSAFSPYRPVTVLTNLQRGNIQTQTSQAEPDDFTLHNRAAMGELSAQDLRAMDSPTQQSSPQPKKKRKPNWSRDETLRLVNVMAEKHLTVNGRFRPSLTQADKKRAWADITNAVNASNVSVRRTEEEVINKWFTVLSQSRKKISAVRKKLNQSGAGGPQAPPLDPVDLKVEEIFGEKNATVNGILPLDANEISLPKLRATKVTLQEQQIDVGHQEQQQQQVDEHHQHQPEQLSVTSNTEIHFDIAPPEIITEVEVDEVDGHGFTPLMWASHYGQLPTARLLLQHRAKADIEGEDGETALLLAASNGHHEIVKLLIGCGADPCHTDHMGNTGLMFAAHGGHSHTAHELLEHGADPTASNLSGASAFSIAVARGSKQVQLILERNLLKLLEPS